MPFTVQLNTVLYTVRFTNCSVHFTVFKLCYTLQFTNCAVYFTHSTVQRKTESWNKYRLRSCFIVAIAIVLITTKELSLPEAQGSYVRLQRLITRQTESLF